MSFRIHVVTVFLSVSLSLHHGSSCLSQFRFLLVFFHRLLLSPSCMKEHCCPFFSAVFGTLRRMPTITKAIRALSLASWLVDGLTPFGRSPSVPLPGFLRRSVRVSGRRSCWTCPFPVPRRVRAAFFAQLRHLVDAILDFDCCTNSPRHHLRILSLMEELRPLSCRNIVFPKWWSHKIRQIHN